MTEKILVVDSDTATRQGAIATLLPAGYQMCIAEDPFTAMSVAKLEQPDLILLADSMASSEGFGLIGRLFSSPETAIIPVAVIANTPEQEDAADRAGARAVFPGPADASQLLQFVGENVHSPGALPGAPKSVLGDPDRLAVVNALRPGPSGNPDLDHFTELA